MAEAIAVLLMAYGGPDSLADVEPYLLDVRGGRPTSPELVAEIRHRYEAIGGRSPIRQHTEAQALGVASVLGARYAVHVGMRHWHPYIKEAVDRIVADGCRRVVGIAMAPHYSALSVGAYEKHLLDAAKGRVECALVRSWGTHPLFLDAVQEQLTQALQRFASPRGAHVVFTAHSLPERIVAAGDPYPAELRATANALAKRLKLGNWRIAYQSAGQSPEPWLGPTAESAVRELAAAGVRDVVIAPVGFVCDHVEVLYDVDVELQQVAKQLGVRLERMAMLNADPMLSRCLADLASRAVRERGGGWTA